MILRACSVNGCGELTLRGRCATHRRVANQDRSRARGPRLYNKARWIATRERVLEREPFCRHCLAEGADPPAYSTQVDHVVPLEDGGDEWARSNLQGLCDHHHSVKTKRERAVREMVAP